MDLEHDIADQDTTSVEALNSVYRRYADDPDFLRQLINLMTQTTAQWPSTWLMKHHLEINHSSTIRVDESLCETVYSRVALLGHWEAKLHILQCMPYLPIPAKQMRTVEVFLRECLADDNKFVRAWAYNGLFILSRQHTHLQAEVDALLASALEHETAPSVKARIRRIIKSG